MTRDDSMGLLRNQVFGNEVVGFEIMFSTDMAVILLCFYHCCDVKKSDCFRSPVTKINQDQSDPIFKRFNFLRSDNYKK